MPKHIRQIRAWGVAPLPMRHSVAHALARKKLEQTALPEKRSKQILRAIADTQASVVWSRIRSLTGGFVRVSGTYALIGNQKDKPVIYNPNEKIGHMVIR
jgi:hypothetical protein